MTVAKAFGDVAEILAKLNPSEIIQLHAPKEMAARVNVLVYKKKNGEINSEESTELERYLALDLLISLAKVRARKMLMA